MRSTSRSLSLIFFVSIDRVDIGIFIFLACTREMLRHLTADFTRQFMYILSVYDYRPARRIVVGGKGSGEATFVEQYSM